jgi:hypothetical protein
MMQYIGTLLTHKWCFVDLQVSVTKETVPGAPTLQVPGAQTSSFPLQFQLLTVEEQRYPPCPPTPTTQGECIFHDFLHPVSTLKCIGGQNRNVPSHPMCFEVARREDERNQGNTIFLKWTVVVLFVSLRFSSFHFKVPKQSFRLLVDCHVLCYPIRAQALF